MNIGKFIFLPILIISVRSCTIMNISQVENLSDTIFTGRVLSVHQWATKQPYSAFIWVFQILYGESRLLEHYKSTYLQRPLYVVINDLLQCDGNLQLKHLDVKIFGVRITHARFYSSFTPLPVTLTNMKAIEGKIILFN